MKIIRIEILTFLIILLSGCYNAYQQFYKPYVSNSALTEVDFLKEGQEPQIFEISIEDFEKQVRAFRAKDYIPIGYSAFNWTIQDKTLAIAQAKSIKATIVLVGSQYTNTQQNTAILPMSNSSTTNTSGNVYGVGISGTYSGTSTTSGTSYVPMTFSQRRYDQVAVYLVKSTKKLRFGIYFMDIPADQRAIIGRNNGAIVELVVEGTPAFYSNILDGDLIDEIDGVKVKDAKHAMELMENVSPEAKTSTFKIIRKDEEKLFLLQLE